MGEKYYPERPDPYGRKFITPEHPLQSDLRRIEAKLDRVLSFLEGLKIIRVHQEGETEEGNDG